MQQYLNCPKCGSADVRKRSEKVYHPTVLAFGWVETVYFCGDCRHFWKVKT